MEFLADNFDDAISELKNKFQLLESEFDLKKNPHQLILFYQAISVRKIEITLQSLVQELQTLNSKLDNITNQMSTNAKTIANEITKLPQAHEHRV